MDINLLVKVTSRAWCLQILAALDGGVAGRQAPLMAATGAGRTAFAQSLAHLVEMDLLARNPGHGHPLRPEYRLTPLGEQMAGVAGKIVQGQTEEAALSLIRRAWTVPVLAVTDVPMRFAEIRSSLPAITDRALSQSLVRLEERRWVARRIDTDLRVPRPLYQAVGRGALIRQAVAGGP